MSEFFKKATRSDSKIKLAITGPAGSGKTYSSLLIARGLVGKKGTIAVCDTEKDSASLYCDLTEYFHRGMGEPHTVDKYKRAIKEAVDANVDCLILDSISHEWTQLLKEKELLDSKGKGNSFTNWAEITKKHDDFINSIVQAPIHIIATMRSKTKYTIQENEKGKSTVNKVGLDPIAREGIDFEFTTVFDIGGKDNACEISKDRTGMFKGRVFIPGIETGQMFADWLKGVK